MFLALDQGTTSSRALAFAPDGRLLATAQEEFAQHFPAPGLVEHDADEIWTTQQRAMHDAWQGAGGGEVFGIGIANQRETVVVWDRATGRPIHRAIVWQDRRTAAVLARMREAGHEPAVQQRTGLPLDPYFSAAKIAHILDVVPGARAAAAGGQLCAGTIDSWLLFKLTGGAVFATEPGNASRTALFDRHRGAFDDGLCELFRVPRRCLPEVRPSAGRFGTVTDTGWPVLALLGDQQAALFGQGCTQPGDAKCTYGTGAFVLCHCGERPPAPAHGLLATVAWQLGGRIEHALEGAVLVSGAVIQWLRDGLGILQSSSDAERVARSVPDSGGVTLVPAFAGLGTPDWDPTARGLLIGITRGTTAAHIVRAAIEAMALQVDGVLAAMAASRGRPLNALRVDGGAAANKLLLQLQASLSGRPVQRPALLESTAFGVCRMAMLASGRCGGIQDLPSLPGAPTIVQPDELAVEPGLRERFSEAVARARNWATT